MEMEDINISTLPPMEGPLSDNDVIDTELSKTAKLEIEPTKEALFYDGQCRSGRFSIRRYLAVSVCVAIGFLVLLVAILLSGPLNNGSASLPEKASNGGGRSPDDDGDIVSFVCLATKSSCPSNVTNEWAQVSHDIVGESGGDLAGWSVSMSCDGSIMAVGAPRNSDNAGHVRVYQLEDNGVWELLGDEIEGVNKNDQAGSSVALSGDGKRVAVGASSNDDSGNNAGHVRVFDLKGGQWKQVGQDIYGEAAGDRSGRAISLSLDGNRLAIGGSLNNATGTEAGHVRVYRMHIRDDRWKQMGQDLDGQSAGDFFGRSVAISGDGRRLAVGGHKNDGDGFKTDSGHVRIFEYDSSVRLWLQIGNDIQGPAAGSWFGYTVSISTDGSVVAIGAPGSSGYLPGFTFVFELKDNAVWKLMGTPVWGGHSVDLSYSGKRVISSSPHGGHNGLQSGTAMVFDYNGTDWNQMGGNILGEADGELSGTSVAISGDGMRASSTAPSADFFQMEDVGFVRVFDYCTEHPKY